MAGEITFLDVTLESWILFVLTIVASAILARTVYLLIRRAADDWAGRRQSKLFARVVEYVILGFGVYIALINVIGLNLTAIAASIGVVGIALAFASQQLISNFVAGVLLALDRRVQLEDWVEVTGGTIRPARVRDMTLTKVVLLDQSGRYTTIPNSFLFGAPVVNYTKAGFVEVPVELKVASGPDLEKTIALILEVADKEDRVLPNVHHSEKERFEHLMGLKRFRLFLEDRPPVEVFKPRVYVQKIDGDAVILSARIWIMEIQRRDEIVSSFQQHLVSRCAEAGVCFKAF